MIAIAETAVTAAIAVARGTAPKRKNGAETHPVRGLLWRNVTIFSPHDVASAVSRFFFACARHKEKAIKKKCRFMGRCPKPRDLLKKVNQNFYIRFGENLLHVPRFLGSVGEFVFAHAKTKRK